MSYVRDAVHEPSLMDGVCAPVAGRRACGRPGYGNAGGGGDRGIDSGVIRDPVLTNGSPSTNSALDFGECRRL